MTRIDRFAAGVGLLAFSVVALADDQNAVQRRCAEKTSLTYGFQCQGQANVGAGLEPVTFVGTVSGSANGIFDGLGTVNSSLGSVKEHLVGKAVFQDRTCFGHVKYRVFLSVGGKDVAEFAPLDIDFATVDGGNEILGVPTPSDVGATGPAVPRLSCRLVNVRGSD